MQFPAEDSRSQPSAMQNVERFLSRATKKSYITVFPPIHTDMTLLLDAQLLFRFGKHADGEVEVFRGVSGRNLCSNSCLTLWYNGV